MDALLMSIGDGGLAESLANILKGDVAELVALQWALNSINCEHALQSNPQQRRDPIHNSFAIQSITARVEVQTGELGAEKMDFSSKLGLEISFWQ